MLELINRSKTQAHLYSGLDLQKKQQLTCVIKTAFQLTLTGALLPLPQLPCLEEIDRYYADPKQSSLAAANEIMPFKQGAEWLLQGTVYPPRRMQAMEVSVTVQTAAAAQQKILQLFGKRSWRSNVWGNYASKPSYFTELPLRYEFAYGGYDLHNPQQGYAFNPAGTGYTESVWKIRDIALPQIEQAPALITRPAQRPIPAGFAAIAPHWQPRIQQQVAATKGDVVPDVHNVAPLDQRLAQPFSGGEFFKLQGLIKNVPLHQSVNFSLPQNNYSVNLYLDNKLTQLQPVCDTVIIDIDQLAVSLLSRIAIPWQLRDKRHGVILIEDIAS